MKKSLVFSLCIVAVLMLLPLPALANDAMFQTAFEAENLNGGGVVTQETFAEAKVTLVNFWATWCGPCIEEMPDLATLQARTGGQVQVIGILLDGIGRDGMPDANALETMAVIIAETGAQYPILLPVGSLAQIAPLVQAMPTTFIVDETGLAHEMILGTKTADEWLALAQAVALDAYGEALVWQDAAPDAG